MKQDISHKISETADNLRSVLLPRTDRELICRDRLANAPEKLSYQELLEVLTPIREIFGENGTVEPDTVKVTREAVLAWCKNNQAMLVSEQDNYEKLRQLFYLLPCSAAERSAIYNPISIELASLVNGKQAKQSADQRDTLATPKAEGVQSPQRQSGLVWHRSEPASSAPVSTAEILKHIQPATQAVAPSNSEDSLLDRVNAFLSQWRAKIPEPTLALGLLIVLASGGVGYLSRGSFLRRSGDNDQAAPASIEVSNIEPLTTINISDEYKELCNQEFDSREWSVSEQRYDDGSREVHFRNHTPTVRTELDGYRDPYPEVIVTYVGQGNQGHRVKQDGLIFDYTELAGSSPSLARIAKLATLSSGKVAKLCLDGDILIFSYNGVVSLFSAEEKIVIPSDEPPNSTTGLRCDTLVSRVRRNTYYLNSSSQYNGRVGYIHRVEH